MSEMKAGSLALVMPRGLLPVSCYALKSVQ